MPDGPPPIIAMRRIGKEEVGIMEVLVPVGIGQCVVVVSAPDP